MVQWESLDPASLAVRAQLTYILYRGVFKPQVLLRNEMSAITRTCAKRRRGGDHERMTGELERGREEETKRRRGDERRREGDEERKGGEEEPIGVC